MKNDVEHHTYIHICNMLNEILICNNQNQREKKNDSSIKSELDRLIDKRDKKNQDTRRFKNYFP